MLLKKDATPQIDFLENWPSHYYELKTPQLRKEFLEKAIAQNLDPENDSYRMELLNKRFFTMNKKKSADSFMHAWLMINTAACNSFTGKRQLKELKGYLDHLCLNDYPAESSNKQQLLTEEWTDFARSYLLACTGSRNYCSTFFSIVPLKDKAVARKLMEEIDLVTRIYPSKFELENSFRPLREIFISTYCQLIEDGESFWNEIPQ